MEVKNGGSSRNPRRNSIKILCLPSICFESLGSLEEASLTSFHSCKTAYSSMKPVHRHECAVLGVSMTPKAGQKGFSAKG